MNSATSAASTSLTIVGDEIAKTLGALDPAELNAVADLIDDSRRVFVLGAGRSGIALHMTAMRFMHLGLAAHVVGDATSPAIGEDDVLLTASGSGTTGSVMRAAAAAVAAGAKVAAITASPASELADLSAAIITVPAAAKLDRTGSASRQYAGSLFEQTVVLIGDAVFHLLWSRSEQSADDLWLRHSNLE